MQQTPESLSPERFLDEVAAALPHSSYTEGKRLLEHARAWSTVFYAGAIPEDLSYRLSALEGQCRYLTM